MDFIMVRVDHVGNAVNLYPREICQNIKTALKDTT
jgi:hypothetical protein